MIANMAQPSLFSLVVCPVCDQNLQVEDERLTCSRNHNFSIDRGVPRFVNSSYADAFGLQWNEFRQTQLDSHTGTRISKDRLVRSLSIPVYKELQNASVLEVGCGAGRFTEVLLETGARVVSIDISTAVDANALNFPQSENHLILQADVGSLPFKEDSFDYVICLGVIQHTPIPENTIRSLLRVLKPNGWIVIDHYGKNIKWYLRSAPLFRFFLKRLEPKQSFKIVATIYAVSIRFFSVSENRLYRKLCNILFPIVFFDKEFPDLPGWAKKEWGLLDSYDSLTDRYKHRRSVKQIDSFFRKLLLQDIQVENHSGTIIGRARKPEIRS